MSYNQLRLKIHSLKIDPEYFQKICSSQKNNQFCKNDRDFKKGDILIFHETCYSFSEMQNGSPLKYTGRVIQRKVIHILESSVLGLLEDWVIMSLSGVSFFDDICSQQIFLQQLKRPIAATSGDDVIKIRENCGCCYGTGICEDIYGNKGSCMTCNGKGYFEFEQDNYPLS